MENLIEKLIDQNPAVRQIATESLLERGHDVAGELLELLPSQRHPTRIAISRVLGLLCPGALPRLLQELADPESRTKKWVCHALKEVDLAPPDFALLIDLTTSRHPLVRKYAYRALEPRHGSDEVMRTLWERLRAARRPGTADPDDLRWLTRTIRERAINCSIAWCRSLLEQLRADNGVDFWATQDFRDLLSMRLGRDSRTLINLRERFLERLEASDDPDTRDAFFSQLIQELPGALFDPIGDGPLDQAMREAEFLETLDAYTLQGVAENRNACLTLALDFLEELKEWHNGDGTPLLEKGLAAPALEIIRDPNEDADSSLLASRLLFAYLYTLDADASRPTAQAAVQALAEIWETERALPLLRSLAAWDKAIDDPAGPPEAMDQCNRLLGSELAQQQQERLPLLLRLIARQASQRNETARYDAALSQLRDLLANHRARAAANLAGLRSPEALGALCQHVHQRGYALDSPVLVTELLVALSEFLPKESACEALRLLAKAIEQTTGQDAAMERFLGLVLVQADQLDLAIGALRRALAQEPDEPFVLMDLARTLNRAGLWAECIATVSHFLNLEATHSSTHLRRLRETASRLQGHCEGRLEITEDARREDSSPLLLVSEVETRLHAFVQAVLLPLCGADWPNASLSSRRRDKADTRRRYKACNLPLEAFLMTWDYVEILERQWPALSIHFDKSDQDPSSVLHRLRRFIELRNRAFHAPRRLHQPFTSEDMAFLQQFHEFVAQAATRAVATPSCAQNDAVVVHQTVVTLGAEE